MQDITIPASGTIDLAYHSSVHNLYVGSSPCAYTTQICPAEDAAMISATAPCKYTPGKPGQHFWKISVHKCLFESIKQQPHPVGLAFLLQLLQLNTRQGRPAGLQPFIWLALHRQAAHFNVICQASVGSDHMTCGAHSWQ